MHVERRNRRRIGLFWKIFLMAGIASTVPLFIAVTTAMQTATNTADELMQRNVLQLANRASERIQYTLVSMESDLNVVAARRNQLEEPRMPPTPGSTDESLATFLRDYTLDQRRELYVPGEQGRRIVSVPKYREVALYGVDAQARARVVDDRILKDSPSFAPIQNRWCETRNFIQEAMRSPQSIVVHPIGCHLSLGAYRPADGALGDHFDGGIRVSRSLLSPTGKPREVATLVLSELHLAVALKSLEEAGNDSKIWGVLVNSEGWALSHPDAQYTWGRSRSGDVIAAPGWGKPGALRITSLPHGAGDSIQHLLDEAETGSPSTVTLETPDGQEWLVAAHPVEAELGKYGEGNPLATVLVFYPRESITAIRTDLQLRFVILLAATLLFVLFASLWLARHFSHPIGQLSRAARDIARGREARPIAIRSDELGDLASAFEQMQKDLRAHQEAAMHNERLAAVGRFVAGIVHEVKNVLAGLGNYVSVLERRVDEDTIQRVIHPMRRALGQLDTLALRMRELTLRPRFAQTDLPSVLGHAVELCENQAQTAHITIHQDLSSDLHLPAADASMLGQVFLNVLLNAIQATPAGGSISIDAHAQEDHVLVQFRDTGEGFPPDEIDSLVEPFYTTREDGTGLGLYISKAIVVRHGGTLQLSNHPDGGAIVRVLLPIRSLETEESPSS